MIRLVATMGGIRPGALVYHWASHYRKLGVGRIDVAFHAHPAVDEESNRAYLRHIRNAGCNVPVEFGGPWDPQVKREMMEKILSDGIPYDWYVFADVDELIAYQAGNLHQAAAACDRAKADAVTGEFRDRVAWGGRLPGITRSCNLWMLFPDEAPVTRDIALGCHAKVCLARKGVRLSAGHHVPEGDVKTIPGAVVHHFKYDATLPERLRLRAVPDYPFRDESRRLLDRLVDHGNRLDISGLPRP